MILKFDNSVGIDSLPSWNRSKMLETSRRNVGRFEASISNIVIVSIALLRWIIASAFRLNDDIAAVYCKCQIERS